MDKNKLQKLAYLFFSFGIGVIYYILVHEMGHLIVMLSAGAKITDFSVLTSHVSSTGGNYTDGSKMWMHANGAVLPVFMSYVFMLLYQSERKRSFYRILAFILTVLPTGSLMAWVIIPFLYAGGKAPAGDDVTNFLEIWTKYRSPYLVSAAAAFLVIAGVYISWQRGIIPGYIDEVRALRRGEVTE